jgi:hypothetical protein
MRRKMAETDPIYPVWVSTVQKLGSDNPLAELVSILFELINRVLNVHERSDIGEHKFNQAESLIETRSQQLSDLNRLIADLVSPRVGEIFEDGSQDFEMLGLNILEFLEAILIVDLRKLSYSWADIAPLVGLSSAGAHRKYSPLINSWLGGTDSLLP